MPAVRLFEHARALGDCAGERAARVAEQLGLDQIVGQRRAVERAERPIAAWAPPMKRARHQLLAAAALSLNQHGEGRRGCALDRLTHLRHRAADSNQLAGGLGGRFVASRDRPGERGTGGRRRHREEHRRREAHREVCTERPAPDEGADGIPTVPHRRATLDDPLPHVRGDQLPGRDDAVPDT